MTVRVTSHITSGHIYNGCLIRFSVTCRNYVFVWRSVDSTRGADHLIFPVGRRRLGLRISCSTLKALLHEAIFSATCNAMLRTTKHSKLLVDVLHPATGFETLRKVDLTNFSANCSQFFFAFQVAETESFTRNFFCNTSQWCCVANCRENCLVEYKQGL